ncbi:hypothetical protein T02_2952 [Trichinella nativa]|uniref:Uncharacterized protein n=1 Tax=Trichinella nativa TaxID=6335 RepID=A0A0V1LE87_9BILA|nr:hypothetical protein T02_2952 [Trichinella nativa]
MLQNNFTILFTKMPHFKNSIRLAISKPASTSLCYTEACAFCQLQLAQYILSGGVGQYSFEEVAVIRRPFVINLINFRICCKSCHFLDNEKQSSSNKIQAVLFLTLKFNLSNLFHEYP